MTFEQLLHEVQVSIINEPFDFVVDFVEESALSTAQRRWQHAEVIDGERHER